MTYVEGYLDWSLVRCLFFFFVCAGVLVLRDLFTNYIMSFSSSYLRAARLPELLCSFLYVGCRFIVSILRVLVLNYTRYS